MPEQSVVNCAQIATIQQRGPDGRLRPPRGQSTLRPIGRLDEARMREVDAALRFNLGV